MTQPHITVPGLGAKWLIGSTALMHTGVGALAIGLAFVVTVAQIVGYIRKDRRYDLLAKRVQLIHVCIYNIGTVVAIGLVFALSGLFPQFWSQIFVHFFWTMIVEELLFFLLATTLTFHYFFWDRMWGHKKLHIFVGALMNPLFFLQVYLINGMSGFMLTPGFQEGQASMTKGIIGWDILAFYNPSFIMLTAHRMFANFSYGGFFVAAMCGVMLYRTKREKLVGYYRDGGHLAFCVGFMSFLSLPIIGYFYAMVLKYHANEAYVNLMWGKGDVVAGGIDWWWLKHVFVLGMLGMSLSYFKIYSRDDTPLTLPSVMVYSIAIFYFMFYFAMGPLMTWKFTWWMIICGCLGALLTRHLVKYHGGSPRAVYLLLGILSFLTVLLGGYAREAARPRFVDRISHYDNVYTPKQRQPYLMVDVDPADIPPPPQPPPVSSEGARLLRERCAGCHTMERVRNYELQDWELIVRHMQVYGLRLSNDEARTIIDHLRTGKPY